MSFRPEPLSTLLPPSIVAFDGDTSTIESNLRALASPVSNTRVNAFNHLRAVPKIALREAWMRVRWQEPPPGWDNESLHRLHIEKPTHPLEGKRAFVTVISAGYEAPLRALLDSLSLRGNCPDVPFVVFCVGDSVHDALEGWNVIRIRCHAHGRVSAAVKGAIYSCTRWLKYESIVALEADMLVVDDVTYLFEAVEQGHKRNLYGCRSQGVERIHRLREVLGHMKAPASDLEFLTGTENLDTLFHFNGGVLAGSWAAWKALDEGFEVLNPFVSMWVEGAYHLAFTDEFAMNLVLSLFPQTLAACELSPGWNAQIIDTNVSHWIQEKSTHNGAQLLRMGEGVRIVHFIVEKPRQFELLARLKPLLKTPLIMCRQCRVVKTCSHCFEPGTFAANRLMSGKAKGGRLATCRKCAAKAEGALESVPLDIRMEIEN
ncbi:hypothetical protein EON83_11190 [bacterium]|nr:MAG: hypothetical protein EON83_11190 [bacterium]